MEKVLIHYQNGVERLVEAGLPILALAEELCPDALAASLNGRVCDLTAPVAAGELRFYTFEDRVGRATYWHTASHVMAQAVQELFPGTKLGIGPAVEEGFYYDFDTPKPLSHYHLEKIEQRMAEIAARALPLVREEISHQEAVRLFTERDEPYKVELLQGIDAPRVSIYRQGDFVDLCTGPHLPNTSWVKAVKLQQVAGAYWRGDEKRPMLQRIYGIAFPTQEQLDEHLARLEEAAKRDHRRIGKEMGLFAFFPEAGLGLPFYLPNGTVVRQAIERFLIDEHRKRGYQVVWTPHIYKTEIWQRSGHREKGYGMFFTEVDGHEYGIKPMNCPGHILIYASQPRSYRDLPIRYFELGTVYRAEQAGVAQGLLRVRGFTQDDAHIFCTPEQLDEEIAGVIQFATDMLGVFGFRNHKFYLSTRPEQSLGDDEIWERATNALVQAMEKRGVPYEVDPGAGVFYGPKIDVHLQDAVGRYWQGPTIQVDFNLPERFDLTYIDSDNRPKRPVMVHRVVLAGFDRFFGLLIEHYAGHFPLWLAPVQVKVLPVSERAHEYAEKVQQALAEAGIRSQLDESSETVSYRVRASEMERVPLIVVVGPREAEKGTVTVRRCGKQQTLPLSEFLQATLEEIMSKRLGPEVEQ